MSFEFPSVSPRQSQELRERIWVIVDIFYKARILCAWVTGILTPRGGAFGPPTHRQGLIAVLGLSKGPRSCRGLCPQLYPSPCREESWVGLLLLLPLWRLMEAPFTGMTVEWLMRSMGFGVRLNWIELQFGLLAVTCCVTLGELLSLSMAD